MEIEEPLFLERGGGTFPRNNGKFLPDKTGSHASFNCMIQYTSCQALFL